MREQRASWSLKVPSASAPNGWLYWSSPPPAWTASITLVTSAGSRPGLEVVGDGHHMTGQPLQVRVVAADLVAHSRRRQLGLAGVLADDLRLPGIGGCSERLAQAQPVEPAQRRGAVAGDGTPRGEDDAVDEGAPGHVQVFVDGQLGKQAGGVVEQPELDGGPGASGHCLPDDAGQAGVDADPLAGQVRARALGRLVVLAVEQVGRRAGGRCRDRDLQCVTWLDGGRGRADPARRASCGGSFGSARPDPGAAGVLDLGQPPEVDPLPEAVALLPSVVVGEEHEVVPGPLRLA